METGALLVTAAVLGAVHTFEADHLAAVTAFVGRRPEARSAIGYSLRWAAGHGGAVMAVGLTLLLIGVQLPASAGIWMEGVVGASLILLGVWVFSSAKGIHAHRHAHADGEVHTHVHFHARPSDDEHRPDAPVHDHGHAATAVGALHGLAGAAPVVALLPVTRLESPVLGLGYLAAFAIGTAAAMALYGLVAGAVAGRFAGRSPLLARSLARLAGAASAAVGVAWLARAAGQL